jgi:hypothetical protein
VMTLAATYPVPGTQGALRIFGAMYLRLHSNQSTPALALVAPSTAVPVTDPSVIVQPISPTDQDYYRLGIGADLIAIFSKWFTKASSTSSGGSS